MGLGRTGSSYSPALFLACHPFLQGMLSPQAAGEREGQKRRAESPIPEDGEFNEMCLLLLLMQFVVLSGLYPVARLPGYAACLGTQLPTGAQATPVLCCCSSFRRGARARGQAPAPPHPRQQLASQPAAAIGGSSTSRSGWRRCVRSGGGGRACRGWGSSGRQAARPCVCPRIRARLGSRHRRRQQRQCAQRPGGG